jgi:hypothetical protein
MRTRYALLSAVAALMFVGGCSDSGDSESADSSGASGSSGAKAGAGAPARQEGQSGAQTEAAQPVNLAPVTGRAIIYTASLRVRARDVSGSAARAKQLVTGAGGYVENETAASDPAGGQGTTATITFRVPADRYATVLEQLGGQLGTRLSLRQQAQDVTQEVADVDSRVKSAEAALASFRRLLDRADTVGEVLNVERELARREADLESLQARQKSLAQQTSFGTVTLQLEAPPKAAVAQAETPSGFLGGLRAGWDAFTAVVAGVAVAVGWLLPFLAVAALIGLPAWRLRRPVGRYLQRQPRQRADSS